MAVFDMLGKKSKKEIDLPPPPPPPMDSFEFPEIPSQREPSIPEPRPLPFVDVRKEAEALGLTIPEPREIHFKPTKPIFISLDDFKKVNENLLKIRSSIEEANQTMEELDRLYQKQQQVMMSWVSELENVEKKISQADEIIHNHEKN